MWWTVAKEAATNWSGHKDARQPPRKDPVYGTGGPLRSLWKKAK